ncbi:hypothetical protein Fmac_031967 [Flemingia macrophylla]|uniref:Uncharacterized protein n=1 Tax=Flemingia macrophylla TaxID=520843 RepID=A0ABD1L3M5_9FABA
MAKSSVVPLQGDDFIFTTLLLMLLLIKSSSNECGEQLSCGPDEPRIRFPFQLVKGTKDVCAYPGFCLYCTQNNDTMLQLPTIKLRVTQIDYQNQKIQLKDPQNCLPVNFLKLDTLDIRPYQFELPYKNQLSYFDCSSVGRPHLRNRYQIDSSSQDMLSCPFYASNAYDSVLELDLTSCTRKFDFYAPVWAESLQTNSLDLTWTKPDCTMCEAKGNRCRWKNNNNTENGVECFKCSKGKQKGFHLPLTFIFSASAKLCSKNPSLVSMTAARGTLGYIAPEVFSRNFGNVSYKSDIYSYGMLLLEMVGGRKNVDMSSTEDFHVLYPDWIHNLVDGDVHIQVEDEGDVKIAKKLAIVGLCCIQWQPENRSSIKSVIQMLEMEEEDRLPVPPNPFHTTSASNSMLTYARRPLELEVIPE